VLWFFNWRRAAPDRSSSGPALSARACPQTWNFEWPPEFAAFDRQADTSEFATWLRAHGHRDSVSRRQLTSLYFEFCEGHQLRPLSWGRFDRSLKPAGIFRVRSSSSVPGRPWVYRVIERQKGGLVLKFGCAANDERPAA
jgi:hypothetical protein